MEANKASPCADTSNFVSIARDLEKTLNEAQQSMLLAAISLERDGFLQLCNALLLDDSQKEKKEQLLRAGIKNIQAAQIARALSKAFVKSFDYIEPIDDLDL
ncbi:MAG: EspG domain-containing protein [Candidatus Micrarchaeaceae archaeon]